MIRAPESRRPATLKINHRTPTGFIMLPKLAARLEHAILTAIDECAKPAILLVGHDLAQLSDVTSELAALDHRIILSASPASAITRLYNRDCVVDTLLVECSSHPNEVTELLALSSVKFPMLVRLISATDADEESANQLVAEGYAHAVLLKPWTCAQVDAVIVGIRSRHARVELQDE